MNDPKSRNRRSDVCSQTLINTAIARQQEVGQEFARAFLLQAGIPDAVISRVIAGTHIRALRLRKDRGRWHQVGPRILPLLDQDDATSQKLPPY